MDEGSTYEQDHVNSEWNNLLADGPIFDAQAFNLYLNQDVVQEVSVGSTDVENVYVDEGQIIQAGLSQYFLNSIKDEEIDDTSIPVSSTILSKPASLPASENWPGRYGFTIGFNAQEKRTKGVTWTYNSSKDKLYVGKDVPCPINFFTNDIMPEGVHIRAMALYTSPESASEVVGRCSEHVQDDQKKNIQDAEHLVRCESPMAVYETDPTTKRFSVVIPYENPPPGQAYSSYIFKFTCFGSCPGPKRRPLMLVFELEKDKVVIGRKKVDVKICACPGRDSKSEDSKLELGQSVKRKKKSEAETSRTSLVSPNNSISISKKAKGMPDEDGLYKITMKDKKCFEFLTQMKKFYNIRRTIKNLPPDTRRYLEQYQQRKGYRFPEELNLMS